MSARVLRFRALPMGALLAFARLAQAEAEAQPQAADLPRVEIIGTASPAEGSLGLDAADSTGSRLGLSSRDIPASVSTIGREQIEERGIIRLQDAAVRTPGLSSAAGAGNGNTAMTARGFSGLNSVVQLIDGTRLIVASGTVSFPVATWPIEAVEVLRGPASVLFGDGAIGGAVNFVTKQPLRDRTVHEGFVTAGSYDTLRAGIGSRGPINADTAYAIHLFSERSGGYIDATDSSLYGYSGSLLFAPAAGLTLQLSADGAQNNGARYRGTPVNADQLDPRLRRSNFNVADSDLEFEDNWLRLKATYIASQGLTLRNELYYLTSKRHFRDAQNYNYVLPAADQIRRTRYVNIFHDQTQLGNRFDATFATTIVGLANKIVAGIDFYRTDFDHINNSEDNGATFAGSSVVPLFNFDPGLFSVNPRPTVLRARTRLQTAALFAENALDLGARWKLVAGVRYDDMKLDSTNVLQAVTFSNRYKPLTGRLGVVWSPVPTVSLYAQVATATDPANGLLVFNAVERERELAKARQVEVGAKGNLPGIGGEWTIAAYRIEKRNLLATDPVTGQTQQVGKQSSEGIELALGTQPLRGWTIDVNLAVLNARFDDFFERVGNSNISRVGNVPPNVPQKLANLWTTYRFAPGWHAGIGVQYVGARTGDNANTTHSPAYTLLDASVGYKPLPNLKLELALRNLSDKAYALLIANNGAQWVLGAPRTVELTARVGF